MSDTSCPQYAETYFPLFPLPPPHPASTPIVYYAERLHLLGLDSARFLVDAVHLLVWHTDSVHDLVVLRAVEPLLLLGLGHAQTHGVLQRKGDENAACFVGSRGLLE